MRFFVGFPAGVASDIHARLIGQSLSERLGQPFIIENKPGAGGNLATEAVIHELPDGYSLLLVTSTNAINTSLYDNLKFDFIRDIAPVAGISRAANVLLVNPSVPAETVPEFIAYAKANPGKINMASLGNGSGSHVAGELFKMMTGIDMVHVPYRSNPFPDLLGGQVQVMFPVLSSTIGYIKAGKLRALAVTTAVRSELLPETPTVGEFVPGYEASTWFGVGAPRDTPVEIIDRLNKEINATLDDPKMKVKIAGLGGAALTGSPAQFRDFIAAETEKWAKVIKFANIKPE